ncbi:protein smg8 [Plakobranchus ocellatus]|uniref:Nonsense-mediated mRNA decay factor SMG8 n=1 Tax=Plakobranchus ocellatus TaxID=259542 RepID=A0AAV4B4Q5_9GAST|nr:protein smg8 [Plakobranchus ocellatus]
MFRRKQDVDKHVNSILLRKRDEKERNSQGYQIARLYADIKEYSIARRYLSGFLSVRENVPAAYQLMGEISEGLGQREVAIDNYKRALDLGGFVSSNKVLVQRICRLYTEIGTDVRRMEHWLEQLEKLDPKSDMIFKLKAQIAEIASANGDNRAEDMEDIIATELVKRPTDLKLRLKLLKLYLDTDRIDEAYDEAVTCDLTTAFMDALSWFECLYTVFKKYGESHPGTKTDHAYNQHYLHVLRNLTYLSLAVKEISECVDALSRFDQQLKHAVAMGSSGEAWTAMLREMKGQMFFMAALVLLKRAQTGAVSWQEVNHLSGACLLASKSMDPLDAQAPWFVSAPNSHKKFYDWWQQQSCDRLSQVGHMLGQLSQKKKWEDITEWGLSVRRDTMTSAGHQRVFEHLYCPRDVRAQGATSFLFQAQEMVAARTREREPFTEQHLLDIDRVAYQVHLGDLNHLVWLCLQRYSPDMNAQPNYHFTLMENIQFSVKNLEDTGTETLSQLDILRLEISDPLEFVISMTRQHCSLPSEAIQEPVSGNLQKPKSYSLNRRKVNPPVPEPLGLLKSSSATNPGVSPPSLSSSGRQPNTNRSQEQCLRQFISQHVDMVFSKSINDNVGRHGVDPIFQLPDLDTWLQVANKMHEFFFSEAYSNVTSQPFTLLRNSLDISTRFSENRCIKVLPLAESAYQQDLPPYYITSYHENRLAKAKQVFSQYARGPGYNKYMKELESACVRYWKSGRQQCETLSLTGNLCTNKVHRLPGEEPGGDDDSRDECEHCSQVRTKAACNCGRIQADKDDPFHFKSANFDFYNQLEVICCSKLEHIPLPVFIPSTPDPKAAPVPSFFLPSPRAAEENKDQPEELSKDVEKPDVSGNLSELSLALSLGQDALQASDFEPKTPSSEGNQGSQRKEMGNVDDSQPISPKSGRGQGSKRVPSRQVSTTEYLPYMIHSKSPAGLLPKFSSFSVCRLGTSGLYSHMIGVLAFAKM